ncbi:hypothetical protein ACFL5O_08055, partial [Myxococcota bacterium]
MCSAPEYCPTRLLVCSELVLLGDDDEFLGEGTSTQYAADSVCNKYGNYGSKYSATSIFNPYGTYGSSYSTLSAYSTYAFTPPSLYCVTTDTKLNAVSKNTSIANAVDPDLLCAALEASGL